MKAKSVVDNPYSEMICRHFHRMLSHPKLSSKESVAEAVFDTLMGTKDLRYGPLPSHEVRANVFSVIRGAIHKGVPIPVVVPWGGRKLHPHACLDVAEVSGIKQLMSLDTCVRRYYEPGMQMNLRIENINAEWLYKAQPESPESVDAYSKSMVALLDIIGGDHLFTPRLESDMMDREKYFHLCIQYSHMLYDYMAKSDINWGSEESMAALRRLEAVGWKGTIPPLQRDYYRSRYIQLYPGVDGHRATHMLAEYLAGAKARHDLKGLGIPESEVNGYIQMNFAHPVPGTPVGMFGTTLHYRTTMAYHSRTHIAPWRAKGYLHIDVDGEIKTKIVSWRDIPELTPSMIVLENNGKSVLIQADYKVTDASMINPTGFIV